MKRIFLFPALALALILAACSNPSGGYPNPNPSPSPSPAAPNAITGFTVAGVAGAVNGAARTVTVTVPQGTATNLAPTITISGASISPASGVSQNFAFLVPYTVTAADGSKAVWTVTVKWVPLAPGANIGTYIDDYIAGHPGTGETAANPVPLPVSGDFSGGWGTLLSAIQTGGKYVALDLSACTGAGVFDPDYTNSTGKGKIVSLILPDTATSIKAGDSSNPTFKGFSALKSVTGGAVTGVGNYAFYSFPAGNCDALETVNLPAAVSIGEWAFIGCAALTTVNLPSVTSIGGVAFVNCAGLTTVNLPAAITIGSNAFEGCTNLATVNIPVVTRIDSAAFYGCTGLTSITLPASLTSIEWNPFIECTNLTNIISPNFKFENGKLLSKDGKTLIAWPGATGSVTLSGITTVGNYAFSSTGLTAVSLPAATSIGYRAFGNCTGLASVNLPAATGIGDYAFIVCTALTSVDLPEAVTIGVYAFGSCAALETVSLPAATSIGERAFQNTGTGPLAVTLGPEVPTLGMNMFNGVTGGPKVVTVTVPNGAGAWSGKTGMFTSTENTTGGPHWGNGFRGGGWNGTGMTDSGRINEAISLTVEEETL